MLDRAKANTEFEALAALARAPATQKLIADEKAAKIAARRKLLAELHALDHGAEAEWNKHEKIVANAIAKRNTAIQALRQADAELNAATGAKAEASYIRTRARERIEGELIAGADLDAIEAFRAELYDESARLRRVGNIQRVETVDRNQITGSAVRNVYSNVASINRRLAAIRDAFAKVDELKLLDDQSKLAERFADIRADFPPVETMPNVPGKAA